MTKQILILILIIFAARFLVAQQRELPKSGLMEVLEKYDSTYVMLNNYLIENNFADKDNYILYLFNLYSWKEFDLSDTCGIYVFGLKESDPTYFLFFKNKDLTHTIIQKNSLLLILNTAIVFFEKNEIEDKEVQLFYTLSLLKFFDSNNEYLLNEKYLPREWYKSPPVKPRLPN